MNQVPRSSSPSRSRSPRRSSRSPKRRFTHRSRSRSKSPRKSRKYDTSPNSPRRYRRSESRESPRPDYNKERAFHKEQKMKTLKKHVYSDDEDAEKKYEFGLDSNKDQEEKKKRKEIVPDPDHEKPSFELSGKLSEEQRTTESGKILKFVEPPDAKKPTKRWLLFPFKEDKALETIPIHRKSCYLFGRDRVVADIPLDHHSCSKQHAVIQFRSVQIKDPNTGEPKRVTKPYILDLDSTNGTILNKEKIEGSRYYELKERDVLKFGFSSREYVLLHEDLAK